MSRYLLTGAAGVIVSKVPNSCWPAAIPFVISVHNLHDAYDVRLKQWRLDQLKGHILGAL